MNDTAPSSNARILSQVTLGDPAKYTTIRGIRVAADGAYCVRGLLNGADVAGVLEPNGTARWTKTLAYQARGMVALATTSPVPRGVLVVGAKDTDGDGKSNVGFATLYAPDGGLLGQLDITSDTSDVWLNDVEVISDTTLISCGGERRAGIEHPFVLALDVKPPGVLTRGAGVTLMDRTGLLPDIVPLPSSAGEIALATCVQDGAAFHLVGLHATWPGLGSLAAQWSLDFVTPYGPLGNLWDVEADAGNVCIAGDIEDGRKGAANHFRSAFAAYVTGAGALIWQRVVAVSPEDETFNYLVPGPDALYAVGEGAAYVYSSGIDDVFGYGLVSKLDRLNGIEPVTWTFGDNRYESAFSGADWSAAGLVCGGFTLQETDGGLFRGWAAALNTSTITVNTGARGPMVRATAPPGAVGAASGHGPRISPRARPERLTD